MNKNQQSYFDNHPHVNEFFFTSDGFAFYNKADAESHSVRLADKEVEHVKREKAITHTITEEDLENNPELKGQVESGDEVALGEEKPSAKPKQKSTSKK